MTLSEKAAKRKELTRQDLYTLYGPCDGKYLKDVLAWQHLQDCCKHASVQCRSPAGLELHAHRYLGDHDAVPMAITNLHLSKKTTDETDVRVDVCDIVIPIIKVSLHIPPIV